MQSMQKSAAKMFAYRNDTLGLQAKLEPGGVWTVQFTADMIGVRATAKGGPAPLQCVADINWGVSGQIVHRRITVADGVSISGTAEYVKITVGIDAKPENPFLVTAAVAPGVRPAIFPPIYQELQAVVVPENSFTDLNVPANIGVTSAFITVWNPVEIFPADDAEVAMRNSFLINGQFARAYNPIPPQWVPLYANSDLVRLYNHALPGTTGSLYYSVAWGIDG